MDLKSWWLSVRPPLWARWAISLLVGVAAVVALVAFVSHHNGNAEAHQNAAAVRQENEQAATIIGQDQMPRTTKVAAGSSPLATLVGAVRAEMRHRIAEGTIDGQLASVTCRQTGRRGARLGFRCEAEAGHVRYPFLAVASTAGGTVVYCKRDAPPVPSENIPVSARCRLS